MSRGKVDREKIINAFLFCAFDKSGGGTSLQDISNILHIKKASLYNHFESREAMYDATLFYCSDYLHFVNFLPDDLMKNNKIYNQQFKTVMNKIVKRYIQLFETEPLFQIYSFVHSEKYFNTKALFVVQKEYTKICENIKELLDGFYRRQKISINSELPEEKIDFLSNSFTSIFLEQLNLYITHKKEVVRQNPESGTGSLFSLPTDHSQLKKITALLENFWIMYLGECNV